MSEELVKKLLELQPWQAVEIARGLTFTIRVVRLPAQKRKPERFALEIKRNDAFRGLLIYDITTFRELVEAIKAIESKVETIFEAIEEANRRIRGKGVEVKI